ncbi:PREDICTED: nucleoporin NUP188 homolog [Rhagoletis zephyria]|uniref:nucleoporin NUP188 homolog n=1 Tax=Rhagoletis zephyria TaxID=28612 RepID=UPI00081121D0|nr:PREDICTED: nucleoporin NUP188 homolog [Rhagoletis zephyria]
MSANGNAITDWKRLWQLVSGIHHETPESTVREELLNVSKELQDGVLQFRKRSASNVKLEDLLKEKKQQKLLPFTQNLQELLDLESQQCWEILCYYLTNEYRGSASSLTAHISSESNMSKLLDDIWGYYTLERMIVLKIVKNLLLFYKVPNHPYHAQYKEILNKITLPKLRDSYLNQLEQLINEYPPNQLANGEFFDYHTRLIVWSEGNAREINEVLHVLLLICEHLPFELKHIEKLFNCFRQHTFGRQQSYLDIGKPLHNELMTRLAYSETILLLKCFDLEDTASTLALNIIDSLDKEIIRMYHNPENGPLLLSWMLLKIRFTKATEEEETFLPCQLMGKRAIGLRCFEYLQNLLTNTMYKDDSLVSRIARKTVYNMLTYMCDFFDGDGSCARHPYIYELLCELLSWPSLAKEFCSEEEKGVRSLFNTLLETFPIDFVHLSMLANSLTKAGMSSFIKAQLESLPIFTDLYDESKYPLRAINEEDYILTANVMPFPHLDFNISANTTAVVLPRPEGYFVHFRISLNYFVVLHHEINCLLAETVQTQGDWQQNERVRRINAGLEYLQSVLQRTKSLSAISAEMVHPTEMCIDLLNKFKAVPQPPVQMLANCLNVCTMLLPLVDAEIFARVITLDILPMITNETLENYKDYALGICFDSRVVGTYLVDVEKKLERYDFLLAYLGFLRSYTKLQRNKFLKIEIPGLIFLLREVFPHMHAWGFQSQSERHKIYIEIMGFVCDILDTVTSLGSKNEKINSDKQFLRDVCTHSLSNMENGMMLLRFVALGNAYLQHTMEMESNWMIQQSHGIVLLVRLAMRILMQLLRLKTSTLESNELSPLEALIYTQPKQRDTLRIIPVVTSYMSNIFDRWLPILSCRLLRRIALEFNMSLLACLDMEPDQIRLTFLQRLPDELESDSLKVAILELVEACIEKQPGVTEAFFKVNSTQEKRFLGKEVGVQIADSILTFLEDYLEAVGKDPKTVEHSLPSKIMNIFHSLWKNGMQSLVEDLTKRPKFWLQLCNPLFSTLDSNARVYTQLLNILSIEIFSTTTNGNGELKQVVSRFFETPNFYKWINYVFDMPKTPAADPYCAIDVFSEDVPEWLCRLAAFKSFLIILLKKQPQFIEIPPKQLKKLAEETLAHLVDRAEFIEDLRPFIVLSELYLFVLLSFKLSYTDTPEEDVEMLKQIIKLLSRLSSCYEDLHIRAKEACLAFTIKCADVLAVELLNDSNSALNFLYSVVSIICTELQTLENSARVENQAKLELENLQQSSSNSLVLSFNLLKTVASIFHDSGPGNWDLPFIVNKVFQRLLSCARSILQLYSKQKLAVELLDVLIVFAKGNCSAEFLHCDVGDYLWLKLLPPKDILQTNFAVIGQTKTDDNSWTVQKWWPIYTRGITLVTIMFEKHKHYFVKQALQFVGIHEQYLVDSLLLAKQTLEPLAMELIKSAVTLVSNLVEFETLWRLEHSQSLFNLMRAVQVLMGHCISMFHQPKNLKCLIAGRSLQLDILSDIERPGFTDEVISAFNNLTEIITLSVQSLLRFSPKLLDLICSPEFLVTKYEPIFEIHFGAPKLNETAMTLSFGTVLSIVGVFTKVLNLQGHGFHEVPLNVIPSTSSEGTSATQAGAAALARTQRQFSKSVSITSVSSANCPPNELLCNLDGELCLLALEHILMLAASQSMLALKNPYLPAREKQIVRREISTELLTFHEFVRKKVLIEHREHREMWYRRKHGLVYMQLGDGAGVGSTATSSSASASGSGSTTTAGGASSTAQSSARRHSIDLRVNVVRRLYLQQEHNRQQQRTPASTSGGNDFEMSHVISPIGAGGGRTQQPAAVSSTPQLSRPPLRRQGEPTQTLGSSELKRNCGVESVSGSNNEPDAEEVEEVDEIQYFPPDEPSYTPLSYVQLVEEDYLHFMSNLFSVICQSD